MDSFTIKGEGDFIKLSLENVYGFPDTTCHWGGYDSRVVIEIKSGNFRVNSSFYTTTGEIFEFFQQLKECNSKVKGKAVFDSYEHNLTFTTSYDDLGHVSIDGVFTEHFHLDNRL